MKLSLTLVLLLAVASVSKAAEDGGDYETLVEEAGDDCPPQTKTVAKILGGKLVRQELEQISTPSGCIWVLRGGTPKRFVNAANCGYCRVDDEGHVACSGPGLAMHPFCRLARGPDCRLYPVGLLPYLPCAPPCPRIARIVSRVLGGKTIRQQLVQISTVTGCIWALSGSTPQNFVSAKNCARYRVDSNNRISAVGAGQAMHPFCKLVRGPDCRLYPVGLLPYLPCAPPCPRIARIVTRVLGGKTIRQQLVQISTVTGCIWALSGSTPQNFVSAKNCARYTVSSNNGISAVGAGQAMHPFCQLVRGPDCRLHPVGDRPELPCKKSP